MGSETDAPEVAAALKIAADDYARRQGWSTSPPRVWTAACATCICQPDPC